MHHLFVHVLIRAVLYPALYWLGAIVVKAVSRGTACVLPFSELGQSDDLVWYELRVYRDGFKYWPPESAILVGGSVALAVVSAYCVWCLS
jgi:hypothetical protein